MQLAPVRERGDPRASRHPARLRRAAGLTLLGLLLCASLTACDFAFHSGSGGEGDPGNGNNDGGIIIITQNATFGGQDLAGVFLDERGVVEVDRGWTGGWAPWVAPGLATLTGHLPAVRVRYDPRATDYGTLLERLLATRASSAFASTWPQDAAQFLAARDRARAAGDGAHGPRLLVHPPATFHPADG